jgi:hypothetical protein
MSGKLVLRLGLKTRMVKLDDPLELTAGCCRYTLPCIDQETLCQWIAQTCGESSANDVYDGSNAMGFVGFHMLSTRRVRLSTSHLSSEI